METRALGRSRLPVSAFALGTMNFGYDWHGIGALDAKTADRLLGMALDAGVTLIDTADVYGYGASEEMLGRLLKGRRGKVRLATKVCGTMKPGDPSSGGLSVRRIEAGLEASLRRLKTDHVDFYMAHAPDPDVPLEESLRAFERAKEDGKALSIGCSNFSGEELAAARGRFEFNQVQYSLACRYLENDGLPACLKDKVGIMAWSPLAGGFLAGKKSGGRRSRPETAFPEVKESRLEPLVRILKQVAQMEGLTPAQTALGWLLSKPWLSCAVLGARTPEQLQENLGARPLTASSVSFLDRASAAAQGLHIVPLA